LAQHDDMKKAAIIIGLIAIVCGFVFTVYVTTATATNASRSALAMSLDPNMTLCKGVNSEVGLPVYYRGGRPFVGDFFPASETEGCVPGNIVSQPKLGDVVWEATKTTTFIANWTVWAVTVGVVLGGSYWIVKRYAHNRH
jgi:hypothetical protein